MAGSIWAVGEVAEGAITRLSTEVATVARRLAETAGRDAVAIVVAADPAGPADELARFIPRVVTVAASLADERPAAAVAAARIAALARRDAPAWIVVGATPDGRDVAGALAVLLDMGVLANAVDVRWDAARGRVVAATVEGVEDLAPVAVVDHVSAVADTLPIEEARVIVAGGRGVGSADGFRIVAELAELLGGSVGATRAAVDAGWIDYAQQVGQTGKTVRPALYLALGISGAIQHRVGMQAAETIVAVNRDPDAPLADYADLYAVGDLFEVGPAIAAEIRARRA